MKMWHCKLPTTATAALIQFTRRDRTTLCDAVLITEHVIIWPITTTVCEILIPAMQQEAQLSLRDCAMHCVIWNLMKRCKMVKKLHLKSPATGEWPSRSIKVTGIGGIWSAIYDFLLIFHCKYISILYHFGDINTYLQKNKLSHDPGHTPFRDGQSSEG